MKLNALILVVALLSACGAPEQVDRPARTDPDPIPAAARTLPLRGQFGGDLQYALVGEPSTFNPAAARELRAKLIAHLTQAALLEFNSREQKVEEGLAERWSVAADGRSAELELRPGLRFSDGRPFDADVVMETFARLYKTGSQNALLDSLLIRGKPLKVVKLGQHAIRINFPEPYAAAEYILTTVPMLPVHRFRDPQKHIEEYWNLSTPPAEMAGLGPFLISEHQPGRWTRLEPNPHYWKVDAGGRRLPYLDSITIHYLEDPNARVLRLRAGDLDLIDQSLSPEDFESLRASADLDVEDAGPSSNLTFFWVNQNPEAEHREWFGNRSFRRALSAAVSRRSIVRNVFFGRAVPAWSIVPSSIEAWHHGSLSGVDGDPAESRRILQEAGFSLQGSGAEAVLLDPQGRPVEFELATTPDPSMGRIAAIIQDDLAAVGIRIRLRQEEFRSVISRIMRSHDYDSALMNLDFPVDPADYLNVFLSSGAMHLWAPAQSRPATQWEGRIDDLMTAQLKTLDLRERRSLFFEIQAILHREVPVIPLVNRNVLRAAQADLAGLQTARVFPFALWNPWALWWERLNDAAAPP